MPETVKQRPAKAMPISPGRPKGVPNKINALLKDAILQAAQNAGGEGGMTGYLTLQAQENPGPFLSLLGKVLPMQIANADGGTFSITVVTGVPRPDDRSDG
jgi:hypothetical protein